MRARLVKQEPSFRSCSALRVWVERARADRSNGKTGLTSEERVDLANLRKQGARAADEAGDSGKAVAFSAKEHR
ncbi:MAG: hypothetical protein E6J62_13440 [Deltaproteobacteria bacterium]|nr:MAG: hypothetical protein E6J62_13440 [Deltaproteobacteria bacterium]